MRTIVRASVLAVGVLLVGSVEAAAQVAARTATPRTGACFYEHVNYGGQYFCTTNNSEERQVDVNGMNDQISSIRVFGNVEVTVYRDRDFGGRSQVFATDVSDLNEIGWGDVITSFRVQPPGRAGRPGAPATPVNGACFYEDVNFTGSYFCSRQGDIVAMVPDGTNDRISSIRLFGNAEIVVFRDRDFEGVSQWLDVSEPDLREFGWNDIISSYRIERRGTTGNRGYGYGRGRGLGYAEPTTGRVEWRGRVDDRVQLEIRGRSIEERTLSGTQADGTAVFWLGLPTVPVHLTVRRLAGRGTVRVVQQPSRQNGYTGVVEIYDSQRGAQEYRVEVAWR